MRIGQLAKTTSISIERIRFYERKGLLGKVPRSSNGYRTFAPEAVENIRLIVNLRGLGLTILQIEDVICRVRRNEGSCEDVVEVVQDRLRTVRRRIQELRQLEARLARLHTICGTGRDISACRIVRELRM